MKICLIASVMILLIGCAKTESKSPTFYEVVAHKADSDWILDRVDGGQSHVRFTMKCDFYKWSSKTPVTGPDACDLPVGQKLVPNPLPNSPEEFPDIWQSGDTMFITSGQGTDRVEQQFTVKSSQVLEHEPGA